MSTVTPVSQFHGFSMEFLRSVNLKEGPAHPRIFKRLSQLLLTEPGEVERCLHSSEDADLEVATAVLGAALAHESTRLAAFQLFFRAKLSNPSVRQVVQSAFLIAEVDDCGLLADERVLRDPNPEALEELLQAVLNAEDFLNRTIALTRYARAVSNLALQNADQPFEVVLVAALDGFGEVPVAEGKFFPLVKPIG